MEADVVSLALPSDIDLLLKHGLIGDRWTERLPNHSQPYTSMIVFVVRKGNPKGIKDWPDLARSDVTVITPNPKTSGNGKLSLLAAWGSIVCRGGTEEQARDYLRRLYQNVPVLGTGARDSTITFTQDKIGGCLGRQKRQTQENRTPGKSLPGVLIQPAGARDNGAIWLPAG